MLFRSATVAIDGAKNAALLAAQMLALSDEALTKRLIDLRASQTQSVIKKNAALESKITQLLEED